MSRGGRRAGRQSCRPRGRPPAGQGPHQAARRVRGHCRAGRRGRPARSARPRAVERQGGRLGPLQQRASAYGKLQSDASHVRGLLAENVGGFSGRPGNNRTVAGHDGRDSRRCRPGGRERARADRARDPRPTASDSCLTAEDEGVLRQIRAKSDRLSTVMRGDHRIANGRCSACRGLAAPPSQGRAARHRPQSARDGALECHDGEDRRPDRPERELRTRARGTCSSASRRGRSSWRSCSGSSSRGR